MLFGESTKKAVINHCIGDLRVFYLTPKSVTSYYLLCFLLLSSVIVQWDEKLHSCWCTVNSKILGLPITKLIDFCKIVLKAKDKIFFSQKNSQVSAVKKFP